MGYQTITRDEWGATPSEQSKELTDWLGWVLHWRDKTKVGARPGADLMKQAERYHEGTKGWADIAYHRGIDRAGNIFEGRDLGRQGAATYGRNRKTMAIVFLFGEDELTQPAIEAARWVIHVEGPVAGFPALLAGPHSKFRPTQCPGNEIREAIEAGAFDDAPAPKEDPLPTTHPSGGSGGPIVRLWLDELDAITYAVTGQAMTEADSRSWINDLVNRVYVEGESDLSGVARWWHWKLTTEGG